MGETRIDCFSALYTYSGKRFEHICAPLTCNLCGGDGFVSDKIRRRLTYDAMLTGIINDSTRTRTLNSRHFVEIEHGTWSGSHSRLGSDRRRFTIFFTLRRFFLHKCRRVKIHTTTFNELLPVNNELFTEIRHPLV